MSGTCAIRAAVAGTALLMLTAAGFASDISEDHECKVTAVCTSVPRFTIIGRENALVQEQPVQLGKNVATILNLQLWRTLVASRGGKNFGSGAVVWSESTIDPPGHPQAEQFARECKRNQSDRGCDLILWGRVSPYGNSALVTASLSVPDYGDEPLWQIQIGDASFEQDFPSRRYTFTPVVLTHEQIRSYSSPNHLEVETEDGRYRIGGSFKALSHINYELTEVKFTTPYDEEMTGTIKLDALGDRGNAVNFAAGVIRLLRKDWHGAVDYWEPLSSGETPAELKIDANWYLALARSKNSKPATERLRIARDEYPFSSTLAKGLIMAELEELRRGDVDGPDNVAGAVNDYCREFGVSGHWIIETLPNIRQLGVADSLLPDCSRR